MIKRLAENKDNIILRQDKGKGVVIMDRGKYTEKCLDLLNSNQFKKLDHDPTKAVENKIKRALRKIKHKLSKQDYIRLYPTGSAPGKFYGTAKKHVNKWNNRRSSFTPYSFEYRNCIIPSSKTFS